MKHLKRAITRILAISLIINCVAITAFAEEQPSIGTTGNCIWKVEGTILTISGKGKMADYNWYNQPWPKDITKVIISKGVTNIGDCAFFEYTNLTDITIPDTVTSIGNNAFIRCSNLKGVAIPDSVKNIGDSAFSECGSIESINIPSGVTSINTETFSKCTGLKSITISESVTNIGAYAFDGCSPELIIHCGSPSAALQYAIDNQRNYSIDWTVGTSGDCKWKLEGTTLTISGKGAMGNYGWNGQPWPKEITKVIIEKGVTNIGDGAFFEYTNLTDITVPDSVTSIGSYAFIKCSKLTGVTIPDSVKSIGDYAFSECSSIENITIPNGVTSIANEAFSNCTNLTDINLPESVTSIAESAFRYCESLASVTIPEEVTDIGNYAFGGCSPNLTIHCGSPSAALQYAEENSINYSVDWTVGTTGDCKWKLKGTTLTISGEGEMDVYSWTGQPWPKEITKVVIEKGVTNIGDCAFFEYTNLTDITIPDTVTSIGNNAFFKCSNLTGVTIPESVTSIGDCAFSNCESIRSIDIPSGVTSINTETFSNCYNLTSVTIPESVTNIGPLVFSGCSTELIIHCGSPSAALQYAEENSINYSVDWTVGTTGDCKWKLKDTTLIISGEGAMGNYGWTGQPWPKEITKVIIEKGVTNIGNGAFYEYTNLTEITIPDSVTTIGNYAFIKCSNLTGVTIPDNVNSIGDFAFSECSNIESINIPSGVTKINYEAFSKCTRLTKITIPESVISFGADAFSGSDNLKVYCPPDSYTHAYVKKNNIKYVLVGATGACAWALDGTALAISGEGVMADYAAPVTNSLVPNSALTAIPTDPAPWGTGTTEAVIEEGVSYVGENAFAGSADLGVIEIPLTVVGIGDGAFDGCTNLTIRCTKSSYAYAYAMEHDIPVALVVPTTKSISLTLDSDININFYMDLPEDADPETEMVFTIGEREVKGAKKTNENGTYFSCPVNALEMNETVKATCIYDGEEYTQKYSVMQYLQEILTGDYDASLKTLAKKIANYGYYTQLYLQNIHPSSVTIGEGGYAAISKYTDADIDVDVADLTDTFVAPAANDNFSLNARSMQFDSATALNYYVTVKSGNEPTATAVNTVTGKSKTVDIKQYSGRVYIITVQDIYATELADDIKVTIKDGANTLELTSSVLDCCGAIIAAHSGDAKTEADNLAINSIVSFYEYYEAAMAYAGK